MKNGLLVWNVVLTIIAGFLLIMHFRPAPKSTKSGTYIAPDSASLNQPFRIAYFEMDSVAANAEVVKDVKSELNRKEEQITVEIENLSKSFQDKFNYYQNQAQAGNLNEEQSLAARQEMDGMNEKIKARKQQLDQEYTDLVTRRQNEIKSKIETFLKEYNKERNFSYIVSYEQGLFYYKDTLYNITTDLVKGLNSSYKTGKK